MRKILILNNDLEIGGIQKSLVEFITYLVRSNEFSIDLLLWQKDGPLQKKLPQEVNVIFQDYPTTAHDILTAKKPAQKAALIFPYIKALYCNRILGKPWMFYEKLPAFYDIAVSYTHNGFPRFFTIDRVTAKQKFLWFHHGTYEYSNGQKSVDQKYYAQFNKIVAVSAANRMVLSSVFPALPTNMTTVPNIVNFGEINAKAAELITDMPTNTDHYIFVTVSRFSKEKGIDLAIEIASSVKKTGLNFKWYFVGDGPQYAEILRLAVEKNVMDVCIFLGSKENPYPYIKIADLYIQSSYVEGHPISIIEALALKKLIVSTDIPSIREVLKDGELGVLCKPEPEIFAREILKLLQDELKQKSRINAVENFNVNNNAAFKALNQLFSLKKQDD